MSLTAAIILVVQALGRAFGFSVNDEMITSVASSVCGVLVVLGIISNPASGSGYLDDNSERENS